jgi:hypothetical protein
MNIWRMKLRAGHGGPDMWPSCKKRGIASMTDPPIYNTDLTRLDPRDVDKNIKTSAMSSIRRFAWEVQGGDIIYVGDSISREMIAKGYVDCERGSRAYRYNKKNPIYPPSSPEEPWRHEIPVRWQKDFKPFKYKDGAPRCTLTRIETAWKPLDFQVPPDTESNTGDEGIPLLDDDSYSREMEASRKIVKKLHASLSNSFRKWMKKSYGTSVIQELDDIDATFSLFGKSTMVEFKICYGAHTRHAIRAALGQLFEYNHFPARDETESWWIVLDHEPSRNDRNYVATLRERYRIPLALGWKTGRGFEILPPISITKPKSNLKGIRA